MEALGSFLKTALYRVIFVLIVGIPAVELFSYAFFDDGFAIHFISSYSNETLTGKLKLNLDHIKLINSNSIPGNATIESIKLGHSDKNYSGFQVEIPLADISLRNENGSKVSVSIIPSNVIEFKNPFANATEQKEYKDIIRFTFRDLSTTGWIFYLTIAWILGEILCFLGETLIGFVFFDYKPFDVQKVEKVSPLVEGLIVIDSERIGILNSLISNLKIIILNEIDNKNFKGNEQLKNQTIDNIIGRCENGGDIERVISQLNINLEAFKEKLKSLLKEELKNKCFSCSIPVFCSNKEEFAKKFLDKFLVALFKENVITSQDFIKASQGNNALAMEISEVHFVLTRVFSGFIALLAILE